MWTKEARIQHAPREERYPSDVTDAEWAIIAPMIPPPRQGGRHRETNMRDVMNGAAYGMPMAAVAEKLSAALHRLQLLLGMDALRRARSHPPHAASEGARGRGPRGKPDRRHYRYTSCEGDRKRGPQRDPVGYDAAKKTKGIKRNVIVDTIGLLLGIAVIPANIQDRDCAANLIRKTRRLFPWIAKIFADGGYAGGKLKAALEGQPVKLEVVKRTDNEGGFKVVRRRWVIERTLSWLRRNRRLMAHYEAFAFIAEGFVKLAMICVMLKRLTEPTFMCAT